MDATQTKDAAGGGEPTAAEAEYARWGTASDTRRPPEARTWVCRLSDEGKWIETTAHRDYSEAEAACHRQALAAALASQPAASRGDGAEPVAWADLIAALKNKIKEAKWHEYGRLQLSDFIVEHEDRLIAAFEGTTTPSAYAYYANGPLGWQPAASPYKPTEACHRNIRPLYEHPPATPSVPAPVAPEAEEDLAGLATKAHRGLLGNEHFRDELHGTGGIAPECEARLAAFTSSVLPSTSWLIGRMANVSRSRDDDSAYFFLHAAKRLADLSHVIEVALASSASPPAGEDLANLQTWDPAPHAAAPAVLAPGYRVMSAGLSANRGLGASLQKDLQKSPEALPAGEDLAGQGEPVAGAEAIKDALIQARGALHLDAMTDFEGKPYGTTTAAQEAIEKALALLRDADRGGGDGWSTDMEAGKREPEVDLFLSGEGIRPHRRPLHFWDPEQRGGGAWAECADRELLNPRDRICIPSRYVTHWRKPPALPSPNAGNGTPAGDPQGGTDV